MKPGKCKALVLFIWMMVFMLLSEARTALANGMPIRHSAPITGNLVPMEEHRVGITGEDLELLMQPGKASYVFDPGVLVHVNVVYRLFNYSNENIDVPVAFLQDGKTSDWAVSLDKKELTIEGVENIQMSISADPYAWIDPFSDESYSIKSGHSDVLNQSVPARIFTMPLSPGEHILSIAYKVRAGWDERRRLNPVYSFGYLLQPASRWHRFQNLSITVRIPFGHRMVSSIPLKKIDRYTWKGNFPELPDEDLRIFFSSTAGTWGGLVNTPGGAITFCASMATVLWFCRRRLLPYLPQISAFMIELLLSLFTAWVGYVTFKGNLFGYPLNILQYPMLWVLVLWIAVPLLFRLFRIMNRPENEITEERGQ